ncbi:MAG: hypothetical protein Q8O99_00855 [bacterium]|nr:hypothetical protein [bacterium]
MNENGIIMPCHNPPKNQYSYHVRQAFMYSTSAHPDKNIGIIKRERSKNIFVDDVLFISENELNDD